MNFYNLKSGFNILPMLKEVSENYKDFDITDRRQTLVPVQRETKTTYLLKDIDLYKYKPTEEYKKYHQCRKFFDWFTKQYSGEIMRAAVVLLPTDKTVYPHRDGEPFKKDKDRFHLVLSGYYDYNIHSDKIGTIGTYEGWGPVVETVKFCAGDLWWFDNKKVHSAQNTSPLPRISIIFDVFECAWRDHINNNSVV